MPLADGDDDIYATASQWLSINETKKGNRNLLRFEEGIMDAHSFTKAHNSLH